MNTQALRGQKAPAHTTKIDEMKNSSEGEGDACPPGASADTAAAGDGGAIDGAAAGGGGDTSWWRPPESSRGHFYKLVAKVRSMG